MPLHSYICHLVVVIVVVVVSGVVVIVGGAGRGGRGGRGGGIGDGGGVVVYSSIRLLVAMTKLSFGVRSSSSNSITETHVDLFYALTTWTSAMCLKQPPN